MTFENAAWAINGPLLGSSLARRAEYAIGGKDPGVVLPGDLKVTQLDTPGVGVQIAPGVGVILNGYQTTPNEVYVASNPSVHTIPSDGMPASNPAAKSYIVAVVIGDPDFSQAGHPWMAATDPPDGEMSTFEYVRPTVIEVSAGATTLPAGYPALPLARIDVPASTTTITDSMITDLRALSNPRVKEIPVRATGPSSGAGLSGTAAVTWPSTAHWDVAIPSWATKASVIGNIEGVGVSGAAVGVLGVELQGVGTLGNINVNEPGAAARGYALGGILDIPASARGTTKTLRMTGALSSTTYNNRLSATTAASVFFILRFEETAA